MAAKNIWFIICLTLITILVLLLVFPMYTIFIESFIDVDTGKFTLQNFKTIFTQLYPYKIAINHSFFVGTIGTLLPFIIALPLAYIFSRYNFRSKKLLISIISASMVMPAFVGAYFWVILLGRFGIITGPLNEVFGTTFSIFGRNAILWSFMWARYPVVFLFLYPAFSNINPELEESAQVLGAGTKKTFLLVSLPMIRPSIINSFYITFLMCITDIGTPMMIGGGYIVLPTLMYSEFMTEMGTGNIPMAGTIGILLLLINMAVLFGGRYYITRRKYETISTKKVIPKNISCKKEKILIFGVWSLVGIGLLPWLFAILGSFIEWGMGGRAYWSRPAFTNYEMVFKNPLLIRGISNTLFLTVTSLLMMIVAGLLIAYILVKRNFPVLNKVLDILVSLPLVIPGTVLALGYVIYFNSPPIILTGTWLILALAFFVRRLPYITRSIESNLYSISDAYEEASLNLGSPPIGTFCRITVRMLLPGVISGSILAFLFTIGTFSSTIILYTSQWTTLPILIYQNSVSAGVGIAASLSVLMLLMQFFPLLIINEFTHVGMKIES